MTGRPCRNVTGSRRITDSPIFFITCTDSKSPGCNSKLLEAHRPGNGYTDYSTPLYWCDFGNAQKTGQVIMGTIRRNIKQPESKKFETRSGCRS